MYLKGIYKKTIYNRDNYTVGLIKVKENDIDAGLNEKTITFTGYFSNINLDDHLLLNGEFTRHNKYGDQFQALSYEVVLPEEKDGIVTFLSSEIFPGIGESKAKKIYEILGNDTINIILQEPERLKEIKGLSKKNIQTLHDKLTEYQDSIELIVKLNDYGFTNRESTLLYNKYKRKVNDIIEENVYNIIDDSFNYKRIDLLALKHQYDRLDKRRVKASIIYLFNEVINSIGDSYLTYNEVASYLKRVLLSSIEKELFDECLKELLEESKLVYEEEKFYLTKMYYAEKNIAKRFVYLNNQKMVKEKNLDKMFEEIQNYQAITYNEEQKEAIKSAFKGHFMIITGGPGTGKTTIIKSIVNLYEKLYKKNYKEAMDEITLLAPTGRAAKRMMESVHFPAQTIHRFLKWDKEKNTFGVNEYDKVNTKMVIIDEASMVDTYLLDSLLKGLYYDTKIILVGDYHQLPSVGPGQLLKDLIESKCFNVIELNTLYRQKENSNIITFAYDIQNGEYSDELFNKDDDLTFIECDSYNLIDKFTELCRSYKDIMYSDIAILAPMYKTINGIDNLNLIAREIFNPKVNQNEISIGDTLYRENDKVIELVNMPDDNVYNGDVGIISSIDNENKQVIIDYDGNMVTYNKSNFLNFKLGYVTSIHKSQGSEYKIVIMIMLKEYGRMLYRKLLYTGVTRAKKNLFILGEDMAIKKSIDNNFVNDRKTTLKDMILKMYEEVSIN